MKPGNKTDHGLKRHQSRFEMLALWSGVAVVAGLIIEVWLAIEFRPTGEPPIQTWRPIVADALVVAGVFFEIMFGRWALRQSDELQARAELALAEATEGAGKAIERAALANERAEAAALELAKFRAARMLSIEQFARISDTAKQYENISFAVHASSFDDEIIFLLVALINVLREAGWIFVPYPWNVDGSIEKEVILVPPVKIRAGGIAVSNVAFAYSSRELRVAAEILASSLRNEGIEASCAATQPTAVPLVLVLVGPKR